MCCQSPPRSTLVLSRTQLLLCCTSVAAFHCLLSTVATMHLEELIIDGFKAYARRTVVTGFDKQFNAITGLNGSGKSSIADALMWLLGARLDLLRVANPTELIYKNGQAGITKATVTAVFNNEEEGASPVGYEQYEKVTVTRQVSARYGAVSAALLQAHAPPVHTPAQVVVGGRTKYLINGHNATTTRVQNLFHSVQLNAANPHFCIMQGRITKVLNMKPAEILGMLEEAAGTRMYETKKQAALKTIEKKASKVAEINAILAEDITPTLEKLRKEQTAYLQWAANNTECERLARFCVAHDFVKAEALAGSGEEELAAMAQQLTAERDAEAAATAEAGMKEAEITALRSQRDGALAADAQRAATREATASKAAVAAAAAHETKAAAAADDAAALASATAAVADAEAALASAEADVAAKTAAAEAAGQSAEAAAATASGLQEELAAVSAGFAHAGAGMGSTAQGALMEAKRSLAAAQADRTAATMRLQHTESALAEVKAAIASASGKQASVQRALDKASATLTSARHVAQDATEAAAGVRLPELKAAARETARAATAAAGKVDAAEASLSAALKFSYDGRHMPAGFRPEAVKGVVANLIEVADPSAATAVEVAAGGKLFNVVVDDQATGKALLKHGRLQRRVTLIPLASVSSRVPNAAAIKAAAVKTKGAAVPALSLVGYPEEVEAAMQFVLGRHFIADTPEAARAVAYTPSIAFPAVTKAGDSFDPSGTLEGGASAAPGSSILLRLAKVATLKAAAAEAAEAAAEAKAALAAGQAALDAAAAAKAAVGAAEHDLELVRAKLGSSEWGRLTAKQLTLQGTLRELQDALATAEDAVTQHSDEIARLQGSMAGGDAARAGEEARLAAALAEARASADAAAATAQEASCEVETAEADLASARTELEAAQAALTEAQTAAAASAEAVQVAAGALEAANAEARQAAELLAEKQGVLSQSDGELRALCEERDAAAKAAAAAARAVKKLSSTLASHKSAVADAKRRVAHLLSAHAWIAQDKAYFGKPGSDFDFEAVEPEAAASRLAELEAAQESLGAGLNKKVLGMMESAEREYAALMDKKRIVENDKAKIQRVICELDEKKAEALAKTWAQVNTDFGSIFSTLLPGVSAQLAPPEGADLADGLEVRVAFGSVWKESLTELSGGQRSLLALSLILALLRFKPAPLYILDEVDAALDLSHTQNIGHMLRSHFKGSQFLVVSLKQGMFSNANVIFRTKFVDGSSAVTRTVPAGASSHSAAAAGAAAVAPPAGDENIGAGSAAGSKRAGARGRSSRAVLA